MVTGDCRSPADVVAKLKSDGAAQASSLAVEILGGNIKNVQLSKGRLRWNKVEKILGSMDWINVEAQDHRGAVIGCARKEVRELETLGSNTPPSAMTTEVERLLMIVVKAQDLAVQRRDANLEIALKANATLIETLIDRLAHLEKGFGKNLDLATRWAHQVAKSRANMGDDDDDDGSAIMEQMLQMWMMQQSGAIGGLQPPQAAQAAQAPPPNGQPPTPTK